MNNPDAYRGSQAEGPVRLTEAETFALLQKGTVLREQMLYSHNCTYVVELGDGGTRCCLAIYKPRDGEAPLWDFPHDTLYRREYLAYVVSEALGWGLVPTTLVRDGPYGIGTMQRFIYAQQGMHYFNLLPAHRAEMTRIAVFDCLVNNTDRKGGHCLVDADDRIWAIDHGLTFSAGPKLRTVMWDLAEEPVPAELRKQVLALVGDRELQAVLAEHLDRQEANAFYRRIDLIAKSEYIPIRALSDPYKPTPWPAI